MVMRAVEGIKVNNDTIAYDLIKKIGPGGNFVTARHTRRFMRKEHYQPQLSNRDSREEWEAQGSKSTWEKAADKVRKIMKSPANSLPEDIQNKIKEEIEGIVS
jgi:trimethylamine--corrinoid protein Co-methyltransferase